ncbi:hypothetical protein ACFE04_024323 [Oxalis oulophora]
MSSGKDSLSWFTPKRLLVVFCVINMLNYVDRGAIASNGVNGSGRSCDDKGICDSGTGIQGAFNLNNFQDGVLSSAFMVGLLIASPIFASLAKSQNPFRLIGVGLSVWTFATAGCGVSWNFWSIAVFRMLVGVGEASFISLAAPFIDDNAPVAQKTAWLAMFYMCIPTGVALGYVYGGVVGAYFNWRYAFFGEAILMLPFAIFGFVMKPLQLKGFAPSESKKELLSVDEDVHPVIEGSGISNVNDLLVGNEGAIKQTSCIADKPSSSCKICSQFSLFAKDMKVLLLDKVYVTNVLGYISYNFVLGAYSYWGPKAGYNIYHMQGFYQENADMVFGGITIVCGIFGTISGGIILDRMSATISNAFKILGTATFFGAIFCFSSFCFKSLYVFIVLFSVGELLIFATQVMVKLGFCTLWFGQLSEPPEVMFKLRFAPLACPKSQGAPVNYVCLHCVSPSLRPLSMAMSTVSIHIFGDVPSSPLVGLLEDHLNNWRKTTLILTSILFLAAAIWFIGIFLRSVDKSIDDDENQIINDTNSSTKPLLEETSDQRPHNVSEA